MTQQDPRTPSQPSGPQAPSPGQPPAAAEHYPSDRAPSSTAPDQNWPPYSAPPDADNDGRYPHDAQYGGAPTSGPYQDRGASYGGAPQSGPPHGGPPPSGPPYGGTPYRGAAHPGAAAPPMNTMAVLALVFAFVFSPLGIVFGVLGRRQTLRSGERGRALATAGLVLGSVFVVLGLAGAVAAVVLAAELSTTTPIATSPGAATSSDAGPASSVSTPAASPTMAPGAPGAATDSDPSTGISGDAVAAQILTQTNGQAADPHCPTDLPGSVGASITCTATVNDQPAQIVVTVTSVQGDTVAFDIDQK